jgi:hypothetical protein
MKPARIEALAWVLIYGGLLAASLGVFVLEYGAQGSVLGTVLCVAGVTALLAGTVLIYVRSRVSDSHHSPH